MDEPTAQDDDTIPNGQLTEITPAMSKASRERAEKEAFENAQKVVDGINAETEKDGGGAAYVGGEAKSPGTAPAKD